MLGLIRFAKNHLTALFSGNAKPYLLLTAIGCTALSGTSFAEESDQKPLRIGYQSSPPYQIIGENGEIGGLALDLIEEIAERLDIELEWVYCPEPPDVHIPARDVDIWPVVTDLPHRRNYIHITKPIYQNSLGILSRSENPIKSPAETAGKKLAYYAREPSLTLVPKLMPQATPVPLPSHADAIRSVLTGESDAAFLWSTKSNSIEFKRAIDEFGQSSISFFVFPDTKLNCGIGADPLNPRAVQVVDQMREELRELVKDGSVQNVYFKYFLDPESEVSSYFYHDELELKNRRLTIAVVVLVTLFALLVVMAIFLRRSSRKAFEASKAKSEFLANMSHEFRTPLNGIMGMTQLAIQSTEDEEQKEMLQIVMQSADALLTIVNDILDLSKIESGRLVVENEPIELSNLVKTTVPFFELVAGQKGLKFETRISPFCPNVFVSDIVRLRQILFNLIGNAVKFTREGKVTVSIDTIRTEGTEYLLFDIKDTGVGIPESLFKEIFEAFNQADSSITRGYGGTGLGLTISKELALQLGGNVHVESVPQKGSVFSVLVPLVRVSEKSQSAPPIKELQPEPLTKQLEVLVVDDNSANLYTMKAALKLLKHKPTLVSNGADAVKLCKNRAFDLIFMDLQMPGMNGWETAREIRSSDTVSQPPIIAITASIFSNEAKEQVFQEMDGLIFKPFEMKELQVEIKRLTNSEATA
ncbi:ATP-binding protein [Pelagicoccus albus]|uniref:Sensory/regulatory protein RpfC n=1 Tax=Pelagicoccus albus TaxID=415222 RepID=A0A7X1B9C8_9BACT|nr:ATP-binding protein [Pelagicoccus albus]MBC2608063.1 response regulator [Pelagicoccus albus]